MRPNHLGVFYHENESFADYLCSIIILVLMRKIDQFNLYSEVLFWLHVVLIILAVFLSVFLNPFVVLLLIFAHKAHVLIFKGCLLTEFQRKCKNFDLNMDFFQYASKRFFGFYLDKKGSYFINYSIYIIALFISVYKSYSI